MSSGDLGDELWRDPLDKVMDEVLSHRKKQSMERSQDLKVVNLFH